MNETLILLLALASKLLIYFGSAVVVGGLFILVLAKEQPRLIRFIRRYILFGTLLALIAVGVNFYAQVGSFAESGWAGMFDTVFISMLWDSSVGHSVMLRLMALGLILLLLLLTLLRSRNLLVPMASVAFNALVIAVVGMSLVLLAVSFSLIGHTTELNLISRFLLSLHVLIAFLWIGSLLPLWRACRCVAVPALQVLMHRFGVIAMGWVSVLLVCGAVLAYQLLGSVNELLTTSYGLMLLAKVGLVVVLLGFAAWHKLRLVPTLTGRATVRRLQRSILLESLVGLGVLVVTALLTMIVGPDAVH